LERKSQRFSLVFLGLLLLALVGLSFWHTSLSFGDFRPDSNVAIVLWGILTLVAIGVLALGFMLLRNLLKLYVERRQGVPGSKLKTKLVGGALLLSLVPVAAMAFFSFTFLSRTLDKWLFPHTRDILQNSEAVTEELNRIHQEKQETDAALIAAMPATAAAFDRTADPDAVEAQLYGIAEKVRAEYVGLLEAGANSPAIEFRGGDVVSGPVGWETPALEDSALDEIQSGITNQEVWARAPVRIDGTTVGSVVVAWRIPDEISSLRAEMQSRYEEYRTLEQERTSFKYFYLGVMALISVFVLFVALWLSLFLSRQISAPIDELAEATDALSSGRFDYRIQTPGIDELAGLVVSFNQMTQALEEQTTALQRSNNELAAANAEIDSRRRFINAILENITPAVFSINAEGRLLKANSSVQAIFPEAERTDTIEDLFTPDDLEEVRYLLKRAQRIGLTSREFEVAGDERIRRLAVTVSSLEQQTVNAEGEQASFVFVVEDMSELLHAQKSAAWNEVARRVAHEIKNPLTPIALSAERMGRLLDRLERPLSPEERTELKSNCDRSTATIVREVESLRRLVDEFSQLARFPHARPETADVNQIVEEGLAVFDGRLEGITLSTSLTDELPPAFVDPEQIKRVVVNLVDNAAEAVQGCWVREIRVQTQLGATPETVELRVSDSGPGISPEDKERLFLPYFSTKNRGTGLGLAIVSRIVGEHGGSIRVEDNRPSGARFIVEVPIDETASASAPESEIAEVRS